MITKGELQRLAAQASVQVELQERDYILGWFLLELARTPDLNQILVFKGGTALRKTYFPAYRFSEDLDFTLVQPIGEKDLQAGVETVCRRVEDASGVQMWVALWKQARQIADEEAYRVRIAYIGPLGRLGSEPPRITLDLTRYERLVLPALRRPIIHPYSDRPPEPRQVLVYRLEEMLAEKLRTLLQRCYPRDLYDVWYLLKHYGEHLDRPLLLHTLEKKCSYKGYAFSSTDDFLLPARRVGMSDAWSSSLQRLVPSLPSYEAMVAELQILLANWLER